MAGSYKTVTALVTDVDTVLADAQGTGAITPARVRQLNEDMVATLAPSETTLTYSAGLSWPLDTNPAALVVLAGNVTITLSGGQSGHSYCLAVKQSSGGSNTVTLVGATLLGAAVWQTAANAVNLMTAYVSGGVRYVGVM